MKHEMTLSHAEPGKEVILRSVMGGRRFRSRLYSMGLIPGTRLIVLDRRRCGAITLLVRDSRLAIGHGMADKITVE